MSKDRQVSTVWVRRVLAGGSLIVAAVLAGCSGSTGESTGSSAPSASVVTVVVATDLAFQPQEIRISTDQRVTVRLQNKGKVLHDWTVDRIAVTGAETRGSDSHAMGPSGGMGGGMGSGMMSEGAGAGDLHVAAEAGRVVDITFTAEQSGEYVFYCTVAGHRQAGMEGRLVVG